MINSILIICTSLNLGGSERQAVWLANKLVDNGYKVFFVSLKDSGILSKDLDERIIVKNFKLGRARTKFSKIYYVLLGMLKIIKIANTNKIGTTISFLYHSNLIGKIVRIFSKHNNSHIVTFRSDRLSKRDSKESLVRTFVFKKFVIDSKTKVVFNSQTGKTRLLLKNNHQHIIFSTPLNKPTIANSKKNKLLYIGRLDELKNVKSLVSAINLLKKNNLELDIFGKGPELPALMQIVKDEELDNLIKFREIDLNISNRMNEYDALILVSTHEAFPNVIIEAMNSGIVSISTKVGDVERLLGGGRGILIEGYDSHSIAESISAFYNLTDEEKLGIINRGKDFITNELNEEKVYKQWISVINKT